MSDEIVESGQWGYNGNVYYSPEKCGLTLINVRDNPHGVYEFNMDIVVQDNKTGKYYMAHDEGNSCPIPFEDVHGFEDMTEISEDAVKIFDRKER